MLQVLGLVVLPLTMVVFRRLPDRGYPFSKALSILLVTYVNWFAVSLGFFGYSTPSLVGITAGLLLVSLFILFRFREELIGSIRDNLKLIVFYEILFLIAFSIFIAIRGHDPNIYGTEKFMDFSFITGISRNTSFPPQDQWLSGEKVNYYYFGYLIIANLIRLASVPPEFGYNLALATLAGLTFVSISSIAYNLSRKMSVAVAAGIFMIFLGNLDGFREFLSTESIGQYNWWNPSRVIGRGDTINEFPFFALLHADLHPHVNALPFFMLMIVSVMNIVFHRGKITWLYFGYLSILVGGLWVMNPWDMPISILLLWIVLALRVIRDKPDLPRTAMYLLAPVIIVICDRFLLYAPFHNSFESFSKGFGAKFAHTSLGQMLLIWGFFFFVLFTFLIMNVVRRSVLGSGEGPRDVDLGAVKVVQPGVVRCGEKLWAIGLGAVFLISVGLYLSSPIIVVAAAAILIVLFAFQIKKVVRSGVLKAFGKLWVIALVAIFLVVVGCSISNMVIAVTAAGLLLAIANLFVFMKEREKAFIIILILVAFGIFLGCEFFYVKDTYGDKLYRMNTLFKFYFQAWTLVAIAAACSLPSIFEGLKTKGAMRAWTAAFAALLLASLAYPVLAINIRSGGFSGRFDLNGISYMEREHPGDYEAVMWLNQYVDGAPVILEATEDPYKYFSRISSNTGLPTVLGWGNHEGLWRGRHDLVKQRRGDVEKIYNTTDTSLAAQLLRKYGVRFVYVGELERQEYKSSGLKKFSSFMKPVWNRRDSVIYEFIDPEESRYFIDLFNEK